MRPDGFLARLLGALVRLDDPAATVIVAHGPGSPLGQRLLHALARTTPPAVIGPDTTLRGPRGVTLRGPLLLGIANLNRADLVVYANLNRADLVDTADLAGADLTGANLAGADLTGADLTGADLTGANLTGANLTGANLTGANLAGADLTGADLVDVVWSQRTTWPEGLHEAMVGRSRPIGGGRWQVMGSGNSGADIPDPVVPVG